MYVGKDPAWLKKEGIFFYKYEYILSKTIRLSRYLKEIPLPSLSLLEWPSVDDSSVSSFHYKLFQKCNLEWRKKVESMHIVSFSCHSLYLFIFLGRTGQLGKLGKCILLQDLMMSYSQFCFSLGEIEHCMTKVEKK